MNSIPIGSLIKDVDMGDIGIVVGPMKHLWVNGEDVYTQKVIWPRHSPDASPMSLDAVENGWVEVVLGT